MTIETHPTGSEKSVSLAFVDQAGSAVTPVTASFLVSDESGTELDSGSVSLAGSPTSADITVSALNNTLAADEWRAYRRVLVEFTDASSNTYFVKSEYFITAVDTLIVGKNSFATWGKLQVIAADLGCLDMFHSVTEAELNKALIGAWVNIGKLSLSLHSGIDQDRIHHVNGGIFFSQSTYDLDAQQISDLDEKVYRALLHAQCIEAEFLLGGNPVEDRRRSGLLSDSSGESTQFFRTRVPLRLPVCVDAAVALGQYLIISGSRRNV